MAAGQPGPGDSTMAKAKRATKRNARRAALALGAAGVSLAMTGGASATAPTAAPSHDNARQIFLGEEEIADTSLATFHVFDKESEFRLRQGITVAAGVGGFGGCAHGGGGGCAHGGGGCAHGGGGGCAHGGGGCAHAGGGGGHVGGFGGCAHGGGGGCAARPGCAGGGCAHAGACAGHIGGCAHAGGCAARPGCAGGGCAHAGACAGHIGGCAGHGCRGFAGHGCRGCAGCGWGGVWLGIACLGSVACTGSCWQWDRYLRRWINVCY